MLFLEEKGAVTGFENIYSVCVFRKVKVRRVRLNLPKKISSTLYGSLRKCGTCWQEKILQLRGQEQARAQSFCYNFQIV